MVRTQDIRLDDGVEFLCAWEGCESTFKGPMPRGWVTLISFSCDGPITDLRQVREWKREAILCPVHTVALEQNFKSVKPETTN